MPAEAFPFEGNRSKLARRHVMHGWHRVEPGSRASVALLEDGAPLRRFRLNVVQFSGFWRDRILSRLLAFNGAF
jgi:hypothetical protein